VLALDMEGMLVEIPEASVEKLSKYIHDADVEKLAKMDPEKLAKIVLEASRK
jgi:hypothetical protein